VAARAKVGPNRSIAITLSLTASRNRTSRARPFRASNQNSQVTQGVAAGRRIRLPSAALPWAVLGRPFGPARAGLGGADFGGLRWCPPVMG
jgi:hypothetical protein